MEETSAEFIALVEGAVRFNLVEHRGKTFANAGNIGDFALGVGQDIGDALRMAFDRRRAVAVTADAKTVFAGDLHQIGRFVENASEIAVFQAFSLPAAGRRARTFQD